MKLREIVNEAIGLLVAAVFFGTAIVIVFTLVTWWIQDIIR
jgi:hypothetical protein